MLDVSYVMLEALFQQQVNDLAKYSGIADVDIDKLADVRVKDVQKGETKLTEDEQKFMDYVNDRTKDFTLEFKNAATAHKEESREAKA